MRRVLERCAALDVHKKQLTACARILGQGGELEELTAEFSTMAADLLALRDWLTELAVTHVAMEATGVYWKPVYYALEDDFEVLLVNAQHVKNVPGLKRALAGAFKPHHALIVSHILAHLDYLDEAIANLTAEVERRLAPFARKAELLTTITGVAARNSQVILAELGPDMSRFPSDRHAASWVAICPGNDRVRRQAPLRQDPQRQPAPARGADRVGQRRRPLQEHLPARPIRAGQTPPRPQEGDRRRRPLDPDRRLPHPQRRRPLPRPRRGLLHPPRRPATNRQAPDRPARTARPRRHPPNANRTGGGRNPSVIFKPESWT